MDKTTAKIEIPLPLSPETVELFKRTFGAEELAQPHRAPRRSDVAHHCRRGRAAEEEAAQIALGSRYRLDRGWAPP